MKEEEFYNILSIDVGITNMGVVMSKVSMDYRLIKVTECKRVDISKIYCEEISQTHMNRLSGKMRHFLHKYKHLFESADFILCEQQPPNGLIVIQEILVFAYPDIILVSPRSVHCFLEIQNLDYDQRKIATTKSATKWLSSFLDFENNTRKHDMADALCILKFWIHKNRESYLEEQRLIEWRCGNRNAIVNFNMFRYIPDSQE